MTKSITHSYYKQKSDEVLSHIHNNLGGDLNIKTLAAKSGISFYHFHRIMKTILQEPLGSYVQRVRLESALHRLRHSNDSVLDIAETIGFSDLAAFSKAFCKEFGISPVEFRNDRSAVLNTHIDYRISPENKVISDLKPKIINVPDRWVCFIEVTGKYGGAEATQAWEELGDFAIHHNLIGWKPDIFTIYYDDPDVVDPNACVSDICMKISKSVKEEGRIRCKLITGAKCLVFRYKGEYTYLWEVYNCIYKDWIVQSGYVLQDRPTFEKYLNHADHKYPGNQLTEIYLPIE